MNTYVRKCPTCRRPLEPEDIEFFLPPPKKVVDMSPYMFCEVCVALPLPAGFRVVYPPCYTDQVTKDWVEGPPNPRVCGVCDESLTKGMYVFGRTYCAPCFEAWLTDRKTLLGAVGDSWGLAAGAAPDE